MSRRIPLCFACLLVAVPAWAAPPDGTAPRTAALASGAASLTLRWDVTPMPAGSLVACRARVVPLGPGAIAQPAEASVVVPGGGAQCALEIPLAWQGGAPPAAVMVIYEMDAQSAAGIVERTGAQTILLPHAAGARLQLTIHM